MLIKKPLNLRKDFRIELELKFFLSIFLSINNFKI